ncbi:hypothetical protein POL72_15395 [Sorangium sp. wiwo2]|uniref:Uncharacterized protein n=1 Tax=Sorangium atrum TaxID=2995308 RepID=A0ABT5BY86_9BACT|nr:hypothetical protein [Sorangium aterium]MDC0679127.1 hypothetical protein [Sorangium aterium]
MITTERLSCFLLDAKEQVCRTRVAGHIAELVQDQQIGLGVPAQAPLNRGERLVPELIGECRRERREAHDVALGERGEAEVLGERALADARLSAKLRAVQPARQGDQRVQRESGAPGATS